MHDSLKIRATLSLLLICLCSLGQENLILNGDFEEYWQCPDNPSFPGDLQVERCIGWTTPRKNGTSDYFNSCNNPINGGLAGVPQNLSGFQYPLNGNGYCGFYAWALNPDGTSYREYLQTELSTPLIEGKIYDISFYVSNDGYNYSVEKIGALFSQDSYTEVSYRPIVANPQVVNKNGRLVDSLNWTKIQGKFISTGNERFLTFGYFEDSLNVSDTLNTYNDAFCLQRSYYYIDGVELIESQYEIPNIFTPNNDGINDLWELYLPPEIHLEITNRWGNLIYKSNGSSVSWDGGNCSDGIYFYKVLSNETIKLGFIQLIR